MLRRLTLAALLAASFACGESKPGTAARPDPVETAARPDPVETAATPIRVEFGRCADAGLYYISGARDPHRPQPVVPAAPVTHRTREQIAGVIRPRRAAFRACYQRESDRRPIPGGKVVIRFFFGTPAAEPEPWEPSLATLTDRRERTEFGRLAPAQQPDWPTPLEPARAAIESCAREHEYDAAVIDLAPGKPAVAHSARGAARLASCLTGAAASIEVERPMRCPIALGVKPLDEALVVDIRGARLRHSNELVDLERLKQIFEGRRAEVRERTAGAPVS